MKKIFLLSITCITVFVSCKKETVQGPQGPAGANGTVPSGSISGYVEQYDQYFTTYTTSLNTITVSIDGANNQTIADAAGGYTLSNVAPGIYDISFIKTGSALEKQQQISFPGNGTLHLHGSISDKATFIFTSGFIKDTISQVKLQVNLTPINKTRLGIVIYGTTSNLDINNTSSYVQQSVFYINPNSTGYSDMFPYSAFDPAKFPSGSTVYVKIYPNNSSNSGYIDYTHNQTVYTGCGTPLPTYTLAIP